MSFAGKLAAISIQITVLALSIVIQPRASRAQVQQVTQALSPEQINLRAKQITVRIDGSGTGSGVIINQSDQNYQVLTNWHVVQNPGQYTIQTIDGRQHTVDYTNIQQLSGLDLAIITFSANQNYQVADLGNSARLIEGQNLYFAGYPGELSQEDNRYYRFFAANLVGILPQSTNNGYALVYNGEAFPGMSGGPVLNRNALLIGIHGEANIHALTGAISNYAIPIEKYQQAIANNKPNNSVATAPQQPQTNNSNSTAENPTNPPEVTLETKEPNTVLSSPDTENNSKSSPEPSSSEADNPSAATNSSSQPKVEIVEATQSGEQKEAFSEPAPSSNEADNPSAATNSSSQPKIEIVEATQSEEQKEASSDIATSVPSETSAPNSQLSDSIISETATIVSLKTGIDYTNLQTLLSNQKWEEADRQTDYLIREIIKIAKRKNPHTFMESRFLTDFTCSDINIINQLWHKYSGGHFGFSSQQQIWLTVNEDGDFSTETWRNFASLVGWKEGEIASGKGYLLYEQLTFDPQKAPIGHLPWWFASSQEQQNLIKHVFNRCNFDLVEQDEDRE